MSKIISLIIKSGSENVWVLTSLTKFSWDIYMEFFYQNNLTFIEQNGWKKNRTDKAKKKRSPKLVWRK